MKTVVLDGHAVNPGDLSWDWLKETGEYTVYDKSEPHEVIARAIDADHIITNKVVFDRKVIDSLPNLKYIGLTATGYNIVDVDYAAEKGIVVTNVPAYSTESVAQHTFALLLELMTRPALHNDSVKRGDWANNSYFCRLIDYVGLKYMLCLDFTERCGVTEGGRQFLLCWHVPFLLFCVHAMTMWTILTLFLMTKR
jgi:lactate dehydrogenase-like 2-hydroxyacid dehydrogenase